MLSGNRPTPFCERTNPQVSIVLSPYQVPAKIELFANRRMVTQEPLCLSHRFELPHPPLPHLYVFMPDKAGRGRPSTDSTNLGELTCQYHLRHYYRLTAYNYYLNYDLAGTRFS